MEISGVAFCHFWDCIYGDLCEREKGERQMDTINTIITTVNGVVYQNTECGAQFAPTVDGRIDRVSVSQDTTEAVNRVLGGEDVSQGALFFRSTRSRSSWFDQSLNRVLEHGNHIFYTL